MATPNLGLTIPVAGVTLGASNNTTPGTYPYIIANDLTLIDSLCYSLLNPAPFGTGGVTVTGNTAWNGYSVSGVGSLTAANANFTGAGTALTVTNNATISGLITLTGGISSPLKVGGSLANTLTFTATATSFNPTLTIAGDATRSLNLAVPSTATSLAGLVVTPSGSAAAFLGSGGAATYAALWLGYSDATANATPGAANYALQGTAAGQVTMNAGSSLSFSISGTAYPMNITATQVQPSVVIASSASVALQQSTAATLMLKGNVAATAGVGVALDNVTAQTSGKALSIRTGGTEVSSFDFAGNISNPNNWNLQVSGTTVLGLQSNQILLTGNAPKFVQGTNPNPIGLYGNTSTGPNIILDGIVALTSGAIASFRNNGTESCNIDFGGNFTKTLGGTLSISSNPPATGTGIKLISQVTMTSTGNVVQIYNNGLAQSRFDWQGSHANFFHLLPLLGSAITISGGSVGGGGTVGAISGSETAGTFTINYPASPTAITANATTVAVVTLPVGFSSSLFNVFVSAQSTTLPSATQGIAFYAIPSSATTFNVYSNTTFTPTASTAVKFQFFCIGSGATS